MNITALDHLVLTVRDIPRTLSFYTRVLGMQLLRQSDNEVGRYTLAFLGFDGGTLGRPKLS